MAKTSNQMRDQGIEEVRNAGFTPLVTYHQTYVVMVVSEEEDANGPKATYYASLEEGQWHVRFILHP